MAGRKSQAVCEAYHAEQQFLLEANLNMLVNTVIKDRIAYVEDAGRQAFQLPEREYVP